MGVGIGWSRTHLSYPQRGGGGYRCGYRVVKDTPQGDVYNMFPHSMDGPFPEGKYKCFFTLLKAVFETFNDRKGELGKVGVAHWSHDLAHDPVFIPCSYPKAFCS